MNRTVALAPDPPLIVSAPLPLITPLSVIEPLLPPSELAVFRITVPAYVPAVALEFVTAPALEMPVPFSVKAPVLVIV